MDYAFLLAVGIITIAIIQSFSKKKEVSKTDEEIPSTPYGSFIDEQLEVELPLELEPTTTWLAMPANNEKLKQLLDFSFEKESSVYDGITVTRTSKKAFITPEIEGWQLVFSNTWIELIDDYTYDKLKAKLIELSTYLGEVQFFCSKPDIMFSAWAKAVNGEIKRIYVWLGEEHENLLVEGETTPAESKFKLINTFSDEEQEDDYYNNPNLLVPDLGYVYDLAKDWSISPEKLLNPQNIYPNGSLGTIKL